MTNYLQIFSQKDHWWQTESGIFLKIKTKEYTLKLYDIFNLKDGQYLRNWSV